DSVCAVTPDGTWKSAQCRCTDLTSELDCLRSSIGAPDPSLRTWNVQKSGRLGSQFASFSLRGCRQKAAKESTVNSTMRDLPAWAISLVVNLSLLMVLHSVAVERERRVNPTEITSVVDQLQEREIDFSEVTASDMVGNDGDQTALTP